MAWAARTYQPRKDRMTRMPLKILAGVAGLSACAFGGAALASGASSSAKATTTTVSTTATPAPTRTAETALTGDALAQVTAAAKAAVPGATIDRVENDADGNAKYEAHVTKADGTHATVYVDESFKLVKVEAGGPGGPGGRHGHGGFGHGGPGNGETPLTGDTATKAKAAAVAKVGGTADVATTETDSTNAAAAYEVHVTKADGTHVEVVLDKDFNVLSVETRPPHGPPAQQASGTGTVNGFFRGH